ncbi:uncharacterized protein LOC123544723 isoform X2 [Mercenaria mercenaria]|nr:uncharacterized protein LOC123544723 isoform X2 [Mercenaria mercenaria]
MPSRKRSVASSNEGAKRKRAVSHTATTTSATNDEAIIALSENTRYRNSRRTTVTTPNVPIPVPVTESVSSVSIQTQHIVDTLTDKLEAIVENKIQQVLGQSGQARPQQVQAPETVPTQQLQQQQQQAESLDDRTQSVFTDTAIQGASAVLQTKSNYSKPTSSTGDILQGIETLLNASLAPSTLETYRRAWKLFHDFSQAYCNGSISLPISSSVIALFVAFLHEKRVCLPNP